MTDDQGQQLLALVQQQYSQQIDQTAQIHNLLQVGLFQAWLLKLVFFLLFLGVIVMFGLWKPRKA